MRLLGVPVKLSRTPGDPARAPGPALGADTEAVLAGLGYAADEIARLIGGRRGRRAAESEVARELHGVSEAFYEPLGGGRFRSTEHTAGPWDPASQHAGPPAALLGRALERCDAARGHAARADHVRDPRAGTCAEVEVEARVVRPGRTVQLLEATLSAGGRPR